MTNDDSGHDATEFETELLDALTAHRERIDVTPPEFSTLLGARQRVVRRNVALSAAAVAVLGIGGVIVATDRAAVAPDAVSGPDLSVALTPASTPVPLPSTETTDATTTTSFAAAEWFCTGHLGTDDDGRELFADCTPIVEEGAVDWACTDRLGSDDVGRVRFSSCEPIGQLGPLPDPTDLIVIPEDIPVRADVYTVEPGDYAIRVATANCVTIDDLEAANGWDDASADFPGPGNVILIPERFDEAPCASGAYTIQSGDISLTIADRFCVTVQDLDRANRDVDGYLGYLPGTEIIIPPSTADTC